MLRRSLPLMAVFTLSPLLLDGSSAPDTRRNAICILYPEQSKVRGTISFTQEALDAPTNIACMVQGLNPKANHGFHIHEFGDLTEGCKTAGPHYNPKDSTHGGPSSAKRHVGDLGNLTADDNGVANICFTDKIISLYGDQSVVGRSVVVHANEDDLGATDHPESSKTGNSGPRIACGVIGLSKEFKSLPEDKDKEKSNKDKEKSNKDKKK
jgi:superoxide dismutase, Cu-Zn family